MSVSTWAAEHLQDATPCHEDVVHRLITTIGKAAHAPLDPTGVTGFIDTVLRDERASAEDQA